MVTGHVERRGKKGWTSVVLDYGYDAQGNRQRKRITVKRPDRKPVTKAQAEVELRKIIAEIDAGTYVEPSGMTFGQLLDRWLEHMAGRVGPNTYKNYELASRVRLKPALGSIPLAGLQPLSLEDLYHDLAAGTRSGRPLSPGSVRLTHVTAHAALKQAVRWQLVGRNVAEAVDPPRIPRSCRMRILSAEEVARFRAAASGHRDAALVDFALLTGARQGELLVLRWSDLDLEGRTMGVERNLVRYRKDGPVIGQPKTSRGRRRIALSEAAVALLKAHRRQQTEQRLRLGGAYRNDDLVFPGEGGALQDPRGVLFRFKTIARHAGFPELTFHDLRHTHATLLLAAGVHPKIVQERLGHSSVAVTIDVYSHVLPGLQEAAAAKLDEILGESGHRQGTK